MTDHGEHGPSCEGCQILALRLERLALRATLETVAAYVLAVEGGMPSPSAIAYIGQRLNRDGLMPDIDVSEPEPAPELEYDRDDRSL